MSSRAQYKTEDSFDLSKYLEPERFGAGIWFIIHVHALSYDKRRKPMNGMTPGEFIRWICEHHPCSQCSKHCSEYILNNPLEDYESRPVYLNDGSTTYYSSFFWTWKFHNSVNVKIGKPRISFKRAMTMYEHILAGDKCEKTCSASN